MPPSHQKPTKPKYVLIKDSSREPDPYTPNQYGTPGHPGSDLPVDIRISGESNNGLIVLVLLGILAFIIFIFSILGFVGFIKVYVLLGDLGTHRYCLLMLASNLYEDGGSASAIARGYAEVDVSGHTFSYSICAESIDTPTSLVLKQVTPPDDLKVGTQVIPVSGTLSIVPDLDNCFSGTYEITGSQAKIIADFPYFYYFILSTSDYPSGIISAALGDQCMDSDLG